MYPLFFCRNVSKWLALMLISTAFALSMQAQTTTLPENMTRESILTRDTAKATHHLFRARRIGGIVNISLGLYAISTGSLVSGSSSFPASILSTLPGDLIVGVGLSKWIRFKKKKEIDLLAAYEHGVPLPAEIQRRLTSRHLGPSTQAKPTVIPDTVIRLSAVFPDTLISASVGISETVTVASILHGDTVRAIHHLFRARRGGSSANIVLGILTIGGGIALAAIARAVTNSLTTLATGFVSFGRSTSSPAPATSPSGLTYSLPGLLITGVGIAKSARFSENEEHALMEAYENGVSLPISIKRRLEYKFF